MTLPAASVSVPVRVPIATIWPFWTANLVMVKVPWKVPPPAIVPATGTVLVLVADVAAMAVEEDAHRTATSAMRAMSQRNLGRMNSLRCDGREGERPATGAAVGSVASPRR